MDGLPLTERGDRPYRSRHDGVMHACGHDGHMAMVLGAGHVLAAEGGFTGTVHLVFQPAEEHGLGAKAMLANGLFQRFPVDAIFGLHNMPGHPTGRISTRVGGLMAGEDNFEIRIIGRGGHAARPQMVVDPIVVAAARLTIADDRVDPDTAPWTASEDFGAFLREVPGCFALLGNGEALGAGGTPLHSPDYDFNDDALETGVAYYVNLVRTALPSGTRTGTAAP